MSLYHPYLSIIYAFIYTNPYLELYWAHYVHYNYEPTENERIYFCCILHPWLYITYLLREASGMLAILSGCGTADCIVSLFHNVLVQILQPLATPKLHPIWDKNLSSVMSAGSILNMLVHVSNFLRLIIPGVGVQKTFIIYTLDCMCECKIYLLILYMFILFYFMFPI